MMNRGYTCIAVLAVALMGAVPQHVQTADYWHGYAGTKTVSADTAARALSWVETDPSGASLISPYGVKTILYTNPNRQGPGQPIFGPDEDEYAHNCSGGRVHPDSYHREIAMTNPHSNSLLKMWRATVARHELMTRFDAVFNDEAVGTAYAVEQPCSFDFDDWLRGESDLQQKLGSPVIYNGLSDFYNRGIAREIALNSTAIGGMEEECYATVRAGHRQSGWQWEASENTEIRMAQAHKYFFCYGRDLTPADQAYDSRMFAYASFLLTYDPHTSVLWEYYATPSGGHVMPESEVVALDPVVRKVRDVDDLRTSGGAYVRSYRQCYIGGRSVGACAAAVNPDAGSAHAVDLRGYNRTLSLDGSGVFDGGTVRIENRPPPQMLGPLQAFIAFK
jgi:hypothetical protein